MNSFIIKLSFQIICGSGFHTAQFDEQLRLIFAEDAEAAFEKGMEIGEAEQSSFYNMNEQLVQWKFTGIADLQPLHNMEHGAEIWSGITEAEDGEQYINNIMLRTNAIKRKFSQTITEEA